MSYFSARHILTYVNMITCSAINYGGLCGTELEQKLSKLYKIGSKGESGRPSPGPQDLSAFPLGEAHPSLFLELAYICVENSMDEVAQKCLHLVPKDLVQKNPRLYLLRDLLRTQLLVMKQDNGNNTYTKASVEVRIKTIGQMEEILMSALRISDPDLVQVS